MLYLIQNKKSIICQSKVSDDNILTLVRDFTEEINENECETSNNTETRRYPVILS